VIKAKLTAAKVTHDFPHPGPLQSAPG
jgi:hypothetical protein